MSFVTIGGKSYERESLSPKTLAQIESIQFCDKRITELQAELAAFQTARNAYYKELRELLPIVEDVRQ
ncbi:DUF6447 family protein [Desulfonatronum lacustre]|uniref:DUF6447 family protein n=1 Tax=Desulfonatronum lacustre TaxID=66849 RepID=UPI000490005D|nr:DUF6447 family protein [Desulfonatronum lacustre]